MKEKLTTLVLLNYSKPSYSRHSFIATHNSLQRTLADIIWRYQFAVSLEVCVFKASPFLSLHPLRKNELIYITPYNWTNGKPKIGSYKTILASSLKEDVLLRSLKSFFFSTFSNEKWHIYNIIYFRLFFPSSQLFDAFCGRFHFTKTP